MCILVFLLQKLKCQAQYLKPQPDNGVSALPTVHIKERKKQVGGQIKTISSTDAPVFAQSTPVLPLAMRAASPLRACAVPPN